MAETMSTRSRAWPWWGVRRERGLFCCMSPAEPEVAQEWSNYKGAESDPLRDMRLFNEVAVSRVHSEAQQWLNAEMSKVIMGAALKDDSVPGSYGAAVLYQEYAGKRMEAFRASFRSAAIAHLWQMLMALWALRGRKIIEHPPFGEGQHQGPRWGQPGRGRKRKARLVARAKQMQAQRR